MGEANERRISSSREMAANLSLFPTDLLQRFMPASAAAGQSQKDEEEEEGEIELNLNLSLGGRFGVDKNPKRLTRSSSVVGTMPIFREEKRAAGAAEEEESPPVAYMGLMRTTSLPTETEEEWRKRKEMQTLRRMEAKRRRSEKQRNISNTNTAGAETAWCGVPRWAAARRLDKHNSRQGSVDSHGGCGGGGGGGGGGSCSSLSELESKPLQASSNCDEIRRSPTTSQPCQEQTNHDVSGTPAAKTPESTFRVALNNPLRRLSSVEIHQGKEKIGMEDMPCVFTKGEGPNGRRVDGILYRYGKGEEVRIMCVCHGSFLSPAEFVKHAGGVDVDHPLRHIVVNTCAASSLL